MNILIINARHYYGGGDSTYAFNLADLLRANGHQVSFFAMQGSNNLPDENSDLFVSYIDYREMNKRKNFLTAVQVASRSIYSVEARRKFGKLLERVEPDIIHVQNIHAHITPSIILEAKKRHIPMVWTLHDYKLICPNSHFLIDQTGQICEACREGRFWQAAKLRCKKDSLLASSMASLEAYSHQLMGVRGMVDAFLCPSVFLRSKLLENGFEARKTHHLPLFLPQVHFHQSTQDSGYFLFLGKVEPLKGINVLLEAARQTPQIQVILAGRAEEVFLNQLLGSLPPNVSYVGYKAGEDLENLRLGARAFVLPSLWYENQPFSILESFAIGKPVIASDLGGMRELVGNNERGILVPPANVQALAEAMVHISQDASYAASIGVHAFEYVTQKHSSEKHYCQLLDVYREVTRL